jgi:5-methylcytosine-specific restriction enzyme A
LRNAQLQRQPLCERCSKEGRAVAAEVVHHRTAHGGDWTIFCTSALESLCKAHHDGDAQRGYSNAVDVNGWPTDPRHPCYQPNDPFSDYPAHKGQRRPRRRA